MLHLLLVTDSDDLRRRLVAARPDVEWLPARSGDEAIDVIARSSRLDGIVVARRFPNVDEEDLLPADGGAADPAALRDDQGLAIAAAIRREVPGNLPIAILGATPAEAAALEAVRGWPDGDLSGTALDAALAELLGVS